MIETACILAGGLGTRLRNLYDDRPKALVPVCGRPFIAHLIEWLNKQGISRVHIAAGYRAHQIKDWVEHCEPGNVAITVSIEPKPLGTAGGLKYAIQYLEPANPLLVLNGDSLLPRACIKDLEKPMAGSNGCKAVLTAVEMLERGQYGTVKIDQRDRIIAFKEKATNDHGWVNGGIYFLDIAILAGIPEDTAASMESDVFPALARSGQLGAIRVPGPLLDMGTPEGLNRMSAFLEKAC